MNYFRTVQVDMPLFLFDDTNVVNAGSTDKLQRSQLRPCALRRFLK